MKRRFTAWLAFILCPLSTVYAQTAVTVGPELTDGTAYYTLFSSTEAIDFSQTPDVEAYVCNRKHISYGEELLVTLTRIQQAPANTGLLIRTPEARDYQLAKATGTVTAVGRNYLKAVTERTDAADLFVVDADGFAVQSPALLFMKEGTVGFMRDTLSHDYLKVDGNYRDVYHRGVQFLEAGTAYLAIDDSRAELLSQTDFAPLQLMAEAEPLPAMNGILAARQLCETATERTDFLLTLTSAYVTYASAAGDGHDDIVIMQDATGGLRLRDSGMGALLQAGQKVSGSLPLYVEYSPYGNEIMADENTLAACNSLTVGSDTLQPMVISEDNIEDYVYNYEWRLVRFNDVLYQLNSGEPTVMIELLGDSYPLFDICQANLPLQADNTRMDVVGYLFTLMGAIYVQPLDFIVGGQSTGITPPTSHFSALGSQSAQYHTLSGQRILQPRKGLYISHGRKWLKR